jgi:hypothetical protein
MNETSTPSAEETAAQKLRLTRLIGGYQVSAVIGAVARLGVADALAEAPATGAELATRLGADGLSLSRLLEATLDTGLFALGDDGRYSLTPLGDLLRSDVPGSLRRYAVVSTEPWRWNAYGQLTHAVKTGEPGFVAAFGLPLWDYLASHREAAASFEESLARIGAARDQAVVRAVDFGPFERVVDVGGGQGGLLSAMLAVQPQLRGILFDLPSVVEPARLALTQAGYAERLEVVAGDFRETVPTGGDCYILSWILHDWDDHVAEQIVRRCRQAMRAGAHLLVVEMVMPEAGQPGADAFRRMVRQTDLEMLAVVGGRERTKTEFEGLLGAAGFAIESVVPLTGMPWSVIEAVAV